MNRVREAWKVFRLSVLTVTTPSEPSHASRSSTVSLDRPCATTLCRSPTAPEPHPGLVQFRDHAGARLRPDPSRRPPRGGAVSRRGGPAAAPARTVSARRGPTRRGALHLRLHPLLRPPAA